MHSSTLGRIQRRSAFENHSCRDWSRPHSNRLKRRRHFIAVSHEPRGKCIRQMERRMKPWLKEIDGMLPYTVEELDDDFMFRATFEIPAKWHDRQRQQGGTVGTIYQLGRSRSRCGKRSVALCTRIFSAYRLTRQLQKFQGGSPQDQPSPKAK